MAKKIKIVVKLALQAGMANPAPPVGTALGPHGIKIMDFCNEFNAKTADMKGSLIPAIITIFEDRSFEFIIKIFSPLSFETSNSGNPALIWSGGVVMPQPRGGAYVL